MMELTDDALCGNRQQAGLQEAVRREKARREEQRNSRLAELQQKEKYKQEAMFKMLGAKPGQKIIITPRKDD
jgi:hypothetical protein